MNLRAYAELSRSQLDDIELEALVMQAVVAAQRAGVRRDAFLRVASSQWERAIAAQQQPFADEIASLLNQATIAGKVSPSKREFYEQKARAFGGGALTPESVEWVEAMLKDLPVLHVLPLVSAPGAAGTPSAPNGRKDKRGSR